MNLKLFVAPIAVAAFGFAATPGIAAGGATENCGPPGQSFKMIMQETEMNPPEFYQEEAGVKSPGQAVKQVCAPGQQP